MGVGDNGKFELEQINLDCQSFGMSSQFEKVGEMAMNSKSFFVTGWDPVVSMAEDVGFKAMPSHHQTDISPYDFGVCGSPSQLVQYPSGSGFGKLAQRWEGADHVMNRVEDCQNSDEQNLELLPEGNKRKRMLDSHAVNAHSQFESIQEEFPHAIDESLKERDEKKQKSEQSPSSNARKLTSKQAKDNSKNGDAPKEEFVHVRARRGQATNSHSLAERVRREKISERMRFLQDLVPGCNKITGKAVMLDEIINYVQSLQQQVEFLSMKLATVNPELNLDIERILSKDILHSHGDESAVSGFYPGMNALCSQLHGSMPSEVGICSIENSRNMMKVTNAQFSSQIPSTWDDELQGVVQMGLVSSSASGNLELHGKWLKSVLDNPDPNVVNYLDS